MFWPFAVNVWMFAGILAKAGMSLWQRARHSFARELRGEKVPCLDSMLSAACMSCNKACQDDGV